MRPTSWPKSVYDNSKCECNEQADVTDEDVCPQRFRVEVDDK